MTDPDRNDGAGSFDEPAETEWETELASGSTALSSSLRALLEPPGDIERRTADVVDRSLRGRSALDLGLDLLGLGWWTFRTILTDDPTPADGEAEGTDHG